MSTRFRLATGEEFFDALDGCGATDGADCFGERDVFWADFDAVLCVATVCDATGVHEDIHAIVGELFASGVHVEESRLPDGVGADE